MKSILSAIIVCFGLAVHAQDSLSLMTNLQYLCSEQLAGRETATAGNAEAQAFIKRHFDRLGLVPVAPNYEIRASGINGLAMVNLAGQIPGSQEGYILVTAHYDHLGQKNGKTYYGCDDNASGVASMLYMAEYMKEKLPQYNLVFVAFDAEEKGLQGSSAWVKAPPFPLEKIKLIINLDMVSKNNNDEIYVAGTTYHPTLRPLLEEVNCKFPQTNLRYGHDQKGVANAQDWTYSSDHGPFHAKGVPFLYFGVEDHPHYHQPTDVFDNTNFSFYFHTTRMLAAIVESLDKTL